MHTLTKFLTEQKSALEQEIAQQKKQLKLLPEGSLLCVQNGKYNKWYLSNGASPIYLSKKERKIAEQLAFKKYLSLHLKELIHQHSLIETYLSHSLSSTHTPSLTCLLEKYPGYQELLQPYFDDHPKVLQEWLHADYIHNMNYSEKLIHPTFSNQNVRSKSEVIIANSLYTHKIPFRYECGINLDDIQFFPDFTICHPITKEIYYWEHFGMMNNSTYSDSAFNKLKVFAHNGIIPSINLITTYETSKCPLDSRSVEKIIIEYFIH